MSSEESDSDGVILPSFVVEVEVLKHLQPEWSGSERKVNHLRDLLH